MKNIAVLGSNSAETFDALVKYFKNKDVKIECFSDNLKSDILQTAQELQIQHKYFPAEDFVEYFGANNFDLIVLCDYENSLSEDFLLTGKFINIHSSLLPAFRGKDVLRRVFSSGVKVSGVTVYEMSNNLEDEKIIAQYPVLIGNTTHFDEYAKEIQELKNFLYPRVIDAILNDIVFDFSDLLKGSCGSGNCGGCGGCH